MIKYTGKDIFEFKKQNPWALIVNPCNTVFNSKGLLVMGAGLAAKFKQNYPKYYKYTGTLRNVIVSGGDIDVHNNSIVTFATKEHFTGPSKLEWIAKGLSKLRKYIVENNIQKIMLPPLGCGLGGLKTEDVYNLIRGLLGDLNADIYVYKKESKWT